MERLIRHCNIIADSIAEILDDEQYTVEDAHRVILDEIMSLYDYHKSRCEKFKKFMEMMQPKQNDTWVVPVESDPINGDFYVTFPDELIEKTGWVTGDTLEWTQKDDESYILRKKEVDS